HNGVGIVFGQDRRPPVHCTRDVFLRARCRSLHRNACTQHEHDGADPKTCLHHFPPSFRRHHKYQLASLLPAGSAEEHGLPSKDRRVAQLPERPSSACSSSTLRAICGPLHRGPISRPYPHREPVLIGVPLELTAYPTRWTSHRCRHLKQYASPSRPATPAPLFRQAMPTVHVFHKQIGCTRNSGGGRRSAWTNCRASLSLVRRVQ